MRVAPLLVPALDIADDGTTLRDVREAVESGRAMLWLLDDLSMVAVMSDQNGYLYAWLLGGHDMDSWIDMLISAMLRYARQFEMKGLKAVTRPGLGRVLRKRGWKVTAEIVRLKA